MTGLALAAMAFIALHLLVSGTTARDALVRRLGEGGYQGLFSLASVAILVWMILAYGAARGSGANTVFWGPTLATRDIQIAVQLFAFLLVVPGLTTPNPTSVGQIGALDRTDPVRGMLRITRHPFLWGVALWAAGHLLVHGTVASLILFGSLLILAVGGTVSIDAKRRRLLGPRWEPFAAATSNIPFAAIAAGRQKLNVAEIGAPRLLAAVVVWAAMMVAHPYAFGVRVLP